MLQTLIGGGQSQQLQQQTGQSAGGDILGSLLGGLTGGEQSQPHQQAPQSAAGDDLLGSLLGGLTGGGNTQANNNCVTPANTGLDMGKLLNTSMAFIQARQSGGTSASA